jgi:hypothetical protein
MQVIKEKLKQIYIPINTGSLALFISLLAVGYVASATNSPCLQAQATCAVGGESEFSGNVGIKGGTPNVATLDASGITADRNIELPDADGELMIGGGLGASKVVATDVSGDLTTTNVYPLSIGTSGQVLTVDATNTFLEYSSITGVPSLTGSEVVKTDPSGNLTTGTVDLDQITTAGASTNDEIRLGAGGSWESFTPSSGGAYTLIDSGSVGSWAGGENYICWHGNTLDATKRYKLIFDSGTGMNTGQDFYIPAYNPVDGDCTSSKNEWEASSIYANAQAHVGNRANSFYESYHNRCYTLQGADSNNSANRTSNIQGEIQFSAIDNGNDYGFWSAWDMSGVALDSSGNITSPGIQWGTGSCIVWEDSYTNPFSDITGFFVVFEGTNGTTRSWALYEIDY